MLGVALNLREFVNSRHPSPRRVWKVGSVARWLPPLPRARDHPAGSASVYQTMVSFTRNDTFPSPKALEALPGQGLARGSPLGAKGTPKGTQRDPNGTQGRPKGTPRTPKGTPKAALGSPRGTLTPWEALGQLWKALAELWEAVGELLQQKT